MSKHTPGPWEAEAADFFGDHNIILHREAGDSRAVAAVVSNMRPEIEVAANAHLIAAAPDLLAALEQAVAEYGKPGGPWNVPSDPGGWLATANAAIAKARGAA